MQSALDLHSSRAKKARLAVRMKNLGYMAWGLGAAILLTVALYLILLEQNQLGYFAAADVRDPLHQMMQKRYEIPLFIGLLKKFLTEDSQSGNLL